MAECDHAYRFHICAPDCGKYECTKCGQLVDHLPSVRASDLLGSWKDDPRTAQEIMDEIRGPR